ncbi:GNAT family N-acetyltransferase [candidate division KSB1 bacterium]
MKIKGKRIILRPRMKKDEKLFVKLANDKVLGKFTRIPQPYTTKHFRKFTKENKERKKEEYFFVIADKKSDEFMGTCTLRPDKRDNLGTIGYWIGKLYRGKGYMPEACKLLINFGFNKLKLHKIVIECVKENKSSKKVIDKLGAKLEGVLREKTFVGGKYKDSLYYSILKKEWRPSKIK